MFLYKGFSHPKDPQTGVNEDAWRADDLQNVVVVSDGASSSIFSSSWANILCQSVIESMPDPMDHFNFPKWLEWVREKWISGIDLNNLSWYQKPKMASGAFATLVWASIDQSIEIPDNLDDDIPLDTDFFRITGYALGDACLLHFHAGKLINSIPVARSADFDSTPPLIGSINLGVDLTASFVPIDIVVPEGDWIILATDAISQWILSQCENGNVPDWREFWNQTPEQFGDFIERLRQDQQIRIDDTTILLCCIGSDVYLDREFNVETQTPAILPEENRFSATPEYRPDPVQPTAIPSKVVSTSSVFLDLEQMSSPVPPIPPRPIPPVPQPEPKPEPTQEKSTFHQTTEIPPLPTDEFGVNIQYSPTPTLPPSPPAQKKKTVPSAEKEPASPPKIKKLQPSQEQRIAPPVMSQQDEEEYKVAQPAPGDEPKLSPYMAELEKRKIAEIEQEKQLQREKEESFTYQFQQGMSEGIQNLKEGVSELLSGPVGEQAKEKLEKGKEAVKKGAEKVANFFGSLFKKK